LKATLGNLTLVHYGINRSAQNSDFETRRKLLFAESNGYPDFRVDGATDVSDL
jgi:hypothetical protein